MRGLDGQGVVDLLEAASGDELDADGQALASAVEARTAGNPFFAGQVLRHLVERGVLVQEEGRWKVHGALADVDLPEGVLDVVGRRLSRLSDRANQALSVAAVCGLEFGARVLCAVPDAGAPDAVQWTGSTRPSTPACWWRPARAATPSPTPSCGTRWTGS